MRYSHARMSDPSDGKKPSQDSTDATVDIQLSDMEDETGASDFAEGRPSLTGTIPPPSRVGTSVKAPGQVALPPSQTSTLIGTPAPSTTPTGLRSPLRPSQALRAERTSVDNAGTETDPHVHNALVLARACEAELLQSPEPERAARLHFEAARQYESPIGDLRRAVSHYQEALVLWPEHVPTLRGARRVLLARKNYQAALSLFDAEARLTSDVSHKAAVLHAKARLLDDVMGQKSEARDAYVAALELDRSDPSLLKSVEQVEQAAEQWDSLSRTLETEANAVAADAQHRAALIVQRAQILEHRKKDPEGAIELYESALQVDPQVRGALSALKRLHHAQRRWRDLISVLQREAAQTTDTSVRAMANYRIGRLHMERLGNRDDALLALEQAAEQAPGDPLVLQELARLYEQGEKWEPLVRVLEKLANEAQGEGDKLARLQRLGQLAADKLNDEDAAMRFHEAALRVSPTYVPSLQALGKIYTRGERWTQLIAINLAEAGASDDSRRRAAAHARVADIFETRLSQVEDAAEHHARALTLIPGYAASFKALSRIYGELGRHRELIELYERAIDGAPDNERAITYLFKIGSIYEDSLQEPVQAAQVYRRILTLDPNHLGAVHAVQRAVERAGRYDELVEALELEAEKTKDAAQIAALLHRAGEILDDKIGDRDAALLRFRKVLSINPKYVPALASLGRIFYRTGRWPDLLEMYGKELEVTPRGPTAVALLLKMGELCEGAIGRKDEAVTYYRRAVEMDPSHAPSLHALSRALTDRGEWPELTKVLDVELQSLQDPHARAVLAYRLGEVYEEGMNDTDRAIGAYEQALRAVPDYRPAVDALARMRATARAWQKLVDDLERESTATRDPLLATAALMRQGEVWADELKEPRRAIASFEAVLSREPAHLGALLALEPLYRRIGAWESLTRVYATEARVLTDVGARVAALRELARLQEGRNLGGPEEVRATYEAILALSPGDMSALHTLERMALEKGDRALLAQVDSWLATTSDDPVLVATYKTRYAESLEIQGDANALAAYREALTLDAENIQATRGLSRMAELANDASAISEAARREAAIARNSETAAAFWVKSARARADKLRDDTGALEDAQRALELQPDSVDAAELVSQLLRKQDDLARLADLLTHAAGNAKLQERMAALWREAAELYSERLQNVAGALGALNRVLKLMPNHVPTLMQLASLYSRDSQWSEAASLLTRVVQLSPDKDTLRAAHLQLATLLDEKLNETPRALASLQAILSMESDNREALGRQCDIYIRQGEIDRASECAQKLVRTSKDSGEKAEALLRFSACARMKGDVSAAGDALHHALALQGPGGPAAKGAIEHLADHGGWERYAASLVEHLSGPRESAAAPRWRAYLELARIQDDELGMREECGDTLRAGLIACDEEPTLREELARRLRKWGQLEQALGEFANLLLTEPARGETYRDISKTYDALRRPDEARLALAPLSILNSLEPSEAMLLQQRPPRPANARPGTFSAESLALIEAGRPQALAAAMLGALQEALPKLYPADLEGFGLSSREKIGPRAGNPLRAVAEKVAAIFGVPAFDLYVHRARTRGVAVEMGDPPAILIPASLSELREAQQVFTFARVFANISRGLVAVEKLTPRELEIVIAAAARTVSPNYGTGLTSEDGFADQNRTILRALSRKSRKAMEDIAVQYVQHASPDYAHWARALKQTANRAALLACDDMKAAIEVLRRTEKEMAGLESTELVKSSVVVADLMRFWVSESAFVFRTRAGLIGPGAA